MTKVQIFASFSAIKNDISPTFRAFSDIKNDKSSNFRTFSDLKNGKVQISKLFLNISELVHSEFRTLFGISCYGSPKGEGGILFFIPSLPEGGGGILFYLCPSVLPSVHDIFRRIFLSNC
jgi:hypothetical protein